MITMSYDGQVDKWDVGYYRDLLARLRDGAGDGAPIGFDGNEFFVHDMKIERDLTIADGAEFGDLKFSVGLVMVS